MSDLTVDEDVRETYFGGPEERGPDRIEIVDGGERVKMVTRNDLNLIRHDKRSLLEIAYPDLHVSRGRESGTVHVGSVVPADDDATPLQIHGGTVIYVAAEQTFRQPTAIEAQQYSEHSMVRSGDDLDEVTEVTIPHPDRIRTAARENDLTACQAATATIPDASQRDEVVREMQERIERDRARQRQLRESPTFYLEPEYDPETDDHIESAESMSDSLMMRVDGLLKAFETTLGVSYTHARTAKARMQNLGTRFLDGHEHIALGVLGWDEATWCRLCGGIGHEDDLLYVDRSLDRHGKLCVCEPCADWDSYNVLDEADIPRAKDRRAKRKGEGQRKMQGFSTAAEPGPDE